MLLLIVLSITGCAGIPLSSVYKMMTADPLEFHPDSVSIAIKRSKAIQINTGDVVMNMHIHSKSPYLKISQKYFFRVDNIPRSSAFVDGLNENQALTVLTLSPEDVIQMKNLQKEMKKHLNNGGSRDDFGFSITVLNGCKNTKNIPKSVLVSLFLKLDNRSEFFPLYENFDVAKADLKPLKNLENWDDCQN